MAVPGHDERDFAFATEKDLPVRQVILPPGEEPAETMSEAYPGPGSMIASGEFDGLPHDEGGRAVVEKLAAAGLGRTTIQYRLRDWLISRQRYWGAPIPIVYCPDCGEVPIPESELPLELPDVVDFKPKGKSPLAAAEDWMSTTCPKCGKAARRDPDTMDTFVCSSWYFLRYLRPGLEDKPFLREDMDKWMPVDMYIGGADHAYGHLIFSRFVTKALHDLGYLSCDEPFTALRHQGMITRDGEKMSKSKGNAVVPADYLERYGTDTLRLYMMFGFAFAEGGDWTDDGIDGVHRYLKRVWRLVDCAIEKRSPAGDVKGEPAQLSEAERDNRWPELRRVMHNSIKGCSRDVERFQFNTAISRLMELTNALFAYAGRNASTLDDPYYREALETLVLMLAPFAPHLGAELWVRLGGGGNVFDQVWPEYREEFLVARTVSYVLQINGKIRDHMDAPLDAERTDIEARALAHGRIPELVGDKAVRKVIVVPNKLVNIVV